MASKKFKSCVGCYQIQGENVGFRLWGQLINNETFSYGSEEKFKLKTPIATSIVSGSSICYQCLQNIGYEPLKDFACQHCTTKYQRTAKNTGFGCATIVKCNEQRLVPEYGSKYHGLHILVLKLPNTLKDNDYICDNCIDKCIKQNMMQLTVAPKAPK